MHPQQVKVTTVDGPVELKIPAGTQPGTTLLMAKRGVPSMLVCMFAYFLAFTSNGVSVSSLLWSSTSYWCGVLA